jgi:cystathionine beta-lyase/cystathionine gamma-synthase
MSGFATRAIRAASRVPNAPQAPVNVPIYQTSTFEFGTAAELGDVLEFRAPGHSYSRYSNPTHAAFEAAIAELEGAEAAHVTGSGMAAVHAAIVSLVPAGGEVVAPRALYGGTYALLTGMLRRLGIGARFVDITDGDAVAAAIGPRTRLVWLETIANPTTAMADIAALAQVAHEHGVAAVVDNTFASPYLCNPLTLGADLVVHSVTKYIGGHSDLLAGIVVGDAQRVAEARHIAINAGGNAQPLEVFLALRGLKTLALRMERHSATARAVAHALEGALGVAAVRYPGLPSHAQHELACRQLRDGQAGGMLALELAGGREAGDRFLRAVRVARHATSLGSVETLCSHPASSSHRQLSDAELSAAGLSPGLLRVSIGLEDPEDLIADLAAAAAGG